VKNGCINHIPIRSQKWAPSWINQWNGKGESCDGSENFARIHLSRHSPARSRMTWHKHDARQEPYKGRQESSQNWRGEAANPRRAVKMHMLSSHLPHWRSFGQRWIRIIGWKMVMTLTRTDCSIVQCPLPPSDDDVRR